MITKIKEAVTLTLPHPNSRGRNGKALSKGANWLNRSSGRFVKEHKPTIYRRAVAMLASPDYSFHDISKATRLSWPTLRAIYEAEIGSIEQRKSLLAQQYSRTLRKLADRVEDTADTMEPREAILGISVLQDKLNILTGSPTSTNLNLNLNATPTNIAAHFDQMHKLLHEKLQNLSGLEAQNEATDAAQVPQPQ
jgi:hypothetical protein